MAAPVLMIDLEIGHRPRSGHARRYDLFLPAVIAFGDGTLERWATDIPATFELCRRIDFECREAAWDGCLYASGPVDWISRLCRALRGRDTSAVIADYEIFEAALSIHSLALRLVETIKVADVGESGGPSVHPLSEGDSPSEDIPFGFAVSVARWRGVNPRSFVDFAVGSGSPDAEAFLETVISQPSRWFNDIPALEAALVRLAADRDTVGFGRAVAEWNGIQDIEIRIPDRRVLVPAVWAQSQDAETWAAEFVLSADNLVTSLLNDRWSWWTADIG